MPTYPYIAIEGAIGVGKSSLARILGEALPAEVLLEVFEENPFLSDFYADRARYAFQTQIFFLLSRYRQQHRVIAETLRRSGLVSDYLFAKDWLFAHLNLAGDELAMYERVHAILGEQIPAPGLVVYLQASTDTLMGRIALRDRPYERQMSVEYINDLRLAYDAFFTAYTAAPVLRLPTDELNFVRSPHDRAAVIARVRDALAGINAQPTLLGLDAAAGVPAILQGAHRLPEFQQFHQALDQRKGFLNDLYLNFILLTEEVGEIGRALAKTWIRQDVLLAQVGNRQEARDHALEEFSGNLGEELADALAYLLKIANDAGIDLESAYLKKMGRNWERNWREA